MTTFAEVRSEEPRQIATARNCQQLADAFVARVIELNTDHLTLDAVAGLADGHAGKLLAPNPTKMLGSKSIDKLLKALGLMLVVTIDPANQPRISAREHEPRDASSVLASRLRTREGRDLLLEVLRNNRKKGKSKISRGMLTKLSPGKRRANARKAARARWRKPRVVEVKGKEAEKIRKETER